MNGFVVKVNTGIAHILLIVLDCLGVVVLEGGGGFFCLFVSVFLSLFLLPPHISCSLRL